MGIRCTKADPDEPTSLAGTPAINGWAPRTGRREAEAHAYPASSNSLDSERPVVGDAAASEAPLPAPTMYDAEASKFVARRGLGECRGTLSAQVPSALNSK